MTMTIRDVMTGPGTTLGLDAGLAAAEQLMHAAKTDQLPVVDRRGRPCGVLGDRNLEYAALLSALAVSLPGAPRWFHRPRVRDVMTWSAVTISPDTPVAHAALLMFERRVSGLPVVDGDRFLGMVTARQVLDAIRTGADRA